MYVNRNCFGQSLFAHVARDAVMKIIQENYRQWSIETDTVGSNVKINVVQWGIYVCFSVARKAVYERASADGAPYSLAFFTE